VPFAKVYEQSSALCENIGRGAFRHKQHAVRWQRNGQAAKKVLNFGHIFFTGNHKFQLAGAVIKPGVDDIRL
jgi:hypothetical protein